MIHSNKVFKNPKIPALHWTKAYSYFLMPHENIHVPFNIIIPTLYEVLSPCVFNFYFTMTNDVEHLFLYLLAICMESDEGSGHATINTPSILSLRNLRNGICTDLPWSWCSILMWAMPSLYLEERSILIFELEATQRGM